ncbi:MAG TPA: guanylate kinase [Candidatus Krumholzibacterium sp.]|nr:guanylate kinase [Candidatus Krumholzibacterium sp.]
MVSGPSGVGKSTVVDGVLAATPGLERSVSVTTRARRGREENGVDYHFLGKDEFLAMRDEGALLEWAEVHGNLYGTSASFVEAQLEAGESVLLEIDVQGAMTVKRRWPDSLLIFIMPPSMEELERRLRERRTDDEETITRRLENAKREIASAPDYDFRVVNDRLEDCIAETGEIIRGWMSGR